MHWYVQKPLHDLRSSAHVWTILNPRCLVWQNVFGRHLWALLTFLKVIATKIMEIVMGKAFWNFLATLKHYIFAEKTGEHHQHRSRFWLRLFPNDKTFQHKGKDQMDWWSHMLQATSSSQSDWHHARIARQKELQPQIAKGKTHFLLIGP